jgi:hypothetical protein
MGAIITCSCKNEFQDQLYGKGKRVHNLAKGAFNKQGGWRCTVCGNLKTINSGTSNTQSK